MFVGVSTACFYPELMEVAFDYLVEGGVKALEVFVNSRLELTPEFLTPLKEKAQSHHAEIVALHPYTSGMEGHLFFSDYRRRVDEGMDTYEQYYRACRTLDAPAVVFHGDRFLTLSPEEHLQRFQEVHHHAKEQGVELCQENVRMFRSGNPEHFRYLREQMPGVQFVLDTKQAVLSGHPVEDYVEAMGIENIHHVHISDNDDEHPCLLPGQGTFDLQGFASELYHGGFRGGLIIELYRDNYKDYKDLLAGYAYLDRLVESIKK